MERNDQSNEFEREKARLDAFESELREAFARRPAPPSLKRGLMERRQRESKLQPLLDWRQWGWQKMAACLVLTATLAGGFEWHQAEQRRQEEAAREQVLTALRITSHALNQMNARLAARHRGEDTQGTQD